MPSFGKRSLNNLNTCAPELQLLFNEVIKHYDCSVIAGHRGEAEQNRYYEKGVSKVKWPNSRHNTYPSNAVDVVPYFSKAPHVRWDDKETFYHFAGFVKGVASQLGIDIRWGGDFNQDGDLHNDRFVDLPHFELKR